jgi:hypothetical protein
MRQMQRSPLDARRLQIFRERRAHVRGRLTIYDYEKQTSANGGPKLQQTRS